MIKQSDKALYKMEAELEVKEPHEITLDNPPWTYLNLLGILNLFLKHEENSLISIAATHLTTTSFQEDCKYLCIWSWYQGFSRSNDQW